MYLQRSISGQWQGKLSCEDNTFVCGIETKYNFNGELPYMGNTADRPKDVVTGDCNLKVNDARFKCCPKKGKVCNLSQNRFENMSK